MAPLFKWSDLLAEQTTEYLADWLEVFRVLIEAARERDDLATVRSLGRERQRVRAELKRRRADGNEGSINDDCL